MSNIDLFNFIALLFYSGNLVISIVFTETVNLYQLVHFFVYIIILSRLFFGDCYFYIYFQSQVKYMFIPTHIPLNLV